MTETAAVSELCALAGIETPERWSDYFDVVRAWSARTDLTAARADEELAEILFLDAAFLIKDGWCRSGSTLLDVGAGVGAPTIPLLLSDETMGATLVEPRRIRTAFLRTAFGTLDLAARAKAIEAKVDPDDPAVAGAPFDVALSRATFPPERWLEVGAQLASEIWVLTAGTEPTEPNGIERARRLDYEVPSSGAPRTILAYRR